MWKNGIQVCSFIFLDCLTKCLITLSIEINLFFSNKSIYYTVCAHILFNFKVKSEEAYIKTKLKQALINYFQMMKNLHSEALHERFGTCFKKNVLNIRTVCQNNSKNNINILIIISGYMNKGWLIFL